MKCLIHKSSSRMSSKAWFSIRASSNEWFLPLRNLTRILSFNPNDFFTGFYILTILSLSNIKSKVKIKEKEDSLVFTWDILCFPAESEMHSEVPFFPKNVSFSMTSSANYKITKEDKVKVSQSINVTESSWYLSLPVKNYSNNFRWYPLDSFASVLQPYFEDTKKGKLLVSYELLSTEVDL